MFDLILSLSANAILVFDENGIVTQANQQAADALGYSMTELIGINVSNLMPQQFVQGHAKLFDSFLRNETGPRRMGEFRQVTARRKTGEEIPVEAAIGRGEYEGKTILLASIRDLSSDLRTQEMLRSLALFPQENPNPVFRISGSAKLLYVNDSGRRMLDYIGLGENEEVPRGWTQIVFNSLKKNMQIVEMLKYSERYYSCTFSPVVDMGYANLYAVDVTDRELEKERLAISDEILNSIGNLVLVANSKAEIVYVSPSVENIIGFTPEELLGEGWWNLERISGGDVEAEKDYVRKAASGTIASDAKPYEHRVRHKDGTWRWLMLSDTKGLHDLLIGIGTDITAIKKTEVELQRQRDFAQTLTEQMGQGLTVTNERGFFEFVNPSYAGMLGYKVEELVGKSPYDVTFPEDHDVLSDARSKRILGDITSYETRLKNKNGAEVFALVTGVPHLVDGKYAGAITVVTDLTERKRMERKLQEYTDKLTQTNIELAEARDQALEASYLKSAFLATISHEIRTPMNAILGMNEILMDTNLDKEQRELAETIDSSTNQLLAILNDVLDFSKIEAGKLSIRTAAFKPVALIKQTVDLYSTPAQEKNISVKYMVTGDIPETLVGDAVRIKQVLGNLISNSIKFTDHGGMVFVNLSGTGLGDDAMMVTFSVQDDGSGIPESAKSILFEPFMQADSTQTRKHGGTGLGLAISKRLVELMHGEIAFESIQGLGSTFWFSLPLGRSATSVDQNVDKKSEEKISRMDFSGCKPALIVEDNLINRDLLNLQLRGFGVTTHHAANGREAMELLSVNPDAYSLILMDINMPEVDGITATRQIRRREEIFGGRTVIVAITANSMMGMRETCLEAGMDDYLSKPATLKDIESILIKWLKPVSPGTFPLNTK